MAKKDEKDQPEWIRERAKPEKASRFVQRMNQEHGLRPPYRRPRSTRSGIAATLGRWPSQPCFLVVGTEPDRFHRPESRGYDRGGSVVPAADESPSAYVTWDEWVNTAGSPDWLGASRDEELSVACWRELRRAGRSVDVIAVTDPRDEMPHWHRVGFDTKSSEGSPIAWRVSPSFIDQATTDAAAAALLDLVRRTAGRLNAGGLFDSLATAQDYVASVAALRAELPSVWPEELPSVIAIWEPHFEHDAETR
jgi:hypothetical protein